MLLAVWDSPTAERLQLPAAFLGSDQTVVESLHIGCMVLDFKRGVPKNPTGHREVSRVVVDLDLAVPDAHTGQVGGHGTRTQIFSPAPLGEISM